MKKLLISIFLMLSLVVSGLSSFTQTPIASAINKSAVRCDFLGQYINPGSEAKKCEPCPVNFYCPLVSGIEIENCSAKGYPDSDCKESRKIFSIDKALPCPEGTITKGFTFNTLSGTRITENGDAIFPIVGQGATDISMCQKPDFVCSGSTPVLLKSTDGVAKCYPLNTCAEDQVSILKNGIPDCSVACKETIVNGKCYQNCPDGEYLEVTNNSVNGVSTQTVICKKIVIKQNECPIQGQVLVNNDIKTCACVSLQVYNEITKSCALPVVPCVAPQTGNQPNCVNPPIKLCPANSYGYSEPNCKPCPQSGTSIAGTVDSSGCVIPVIPCPANYFGTNGNILCSPCPNGGTSTAGTQTVTGCVIPQVVVVPCPANYYGVNGNALCTPCPNNDTSSAGTKDASGCKAQETGGGGFCSGLWAILCGGVVAGVVDCFLTKFVCNKSQPSTPKITNITPKINTTPGQIVKRDILAVYETAYSEQVDAQCVGGNSDLISTVYANNPADAHNPDNGMFVWVATYSEGNVTKSMSTIRPAGGQDGKSSSAEDLNSKPIDKDLQCLMQRYAKMPREGKPSGLVFGSSEYMKALKNDRILHGLNRKFKLECIDLIALGDALQIYGENSVEKSSSEFFVRNETKQTDYPQKFVTQAEAETYMNSLVVKVKAKPKASKRVMIPNFFGAISASAEADTDETNPGETSVSLPDAGLIAYNNPTSNSENKLSEIAAFVCEYEDGSPAPDEECPETEDQTSETDSQYSQYYNLDECDQYAPYYYYSLSETQYSCYELRKLIDAIYKDSGIIDPKSPTTYSENTTTDATFAMYENEVCKDAYPNYPYYYTDKSGNVNCFSTESLTKQLSEDAATDNGTTSNDNTIQPNTAIYGSNCQYNNNTGYYESSETSFYSYGDCKSAAEIKLKTDLEKATLPNNEDTINKLRDSCNSNSTTIWDELSETCVSYVVDNDPLSALNNNYTKSDEEKCNENGGSYGDEVDSEGNSTGVTKCNY
jgi:hypothetical protein